MRSGKAAYEFATRSSILSRMVGMETCKRRRTELRHLGPFGVGLRLFDQNPFDDVGRTEVSVGRVGFANVDKEEVGLVFLVLVPVFDVTDIAPKRPSRVAGKHQRGRSSTEFRHRDLLFAVFVLRVKSGATSPGIGPTPRLPAGLCASAAPVETTRSRTSIFQVFISLDLSGYLASNNSDQSASGQV